MATIVEDSTNVPVTSPGILYPALSHRFTLWFAPDPDAAGVWDGTLVSKQVIDVSYSLSTKIVSFQCEETQDCASTTDAILRLPEVVRTICIAQFSERGAVPNEKVVGTVLYGLSLDNHFVERSYAHSKVVSHSFRFKFEHCRARMVKLAS